MEKPKYLRHSRIAKNHTKYGIYLCSCGKEFEARNSHINAGQASCGCARKKPPIKVTHGCYGKEGYAAWYGMMDRCYRDKNPCYPVYGGRGVKVCNEWLDASVFCEWAALNGIKKGLQLDRVDNNKGYSPENCRFVTPSENASNRFGTYWWHTPMGVFPSLKKASEHYGKWIAHRFNRQDLPEYYKEPKYENYRCDERENGANP
jgi:hypothetical protein